MHEKNSSKKKLSDNSRTCDILQSLHVEISIKVRLPLKWEPHNREVSMWFLPACFFCLFFVCLFVVVLVFSFFAFLCVFVCLFVFLLFCFCFVFVYFCLFFYGGGQLLFFGGCFVFVCFFSSVLLTDRLFRVYDCKCKYDMNNPERYRGRGHFVYALGQRERPYIDAVYLYSWYFGWNSQHGTYSNRFGLRKESWGPFY